MTGFPSFLKVSVAFKEGAAARLSDVGVLQSGT
jgi:hypothetical protein